MGMAGKNEVVAIRTGLPHQVPPGGLAVVLCDGAIADRDPMQGAGLLSPVPWQDDSQHVEAVVFPNTGLRLRFEVTNLRSAEGVRLDLTVHLALRITDPVRFLTDVVRDTQELRAHALADLLGDMVHTGLAPVVAQLNLVELATDPDLRLWLGEAVKQSLEDADLRARSGLSVESLDAYDLRCEIWREEQKARETYYLQAALAHAQATGRRVLDARMLAELRQHLPIKEELVPLKERLAGLVEREAQADARMAAVGERVQTAESTSAWRRALYNPPSILRPELWRHHLGAEVDTAPLSNGERVYVGTRQGDIHVYTAATGEPAWANPSRLGVSPGDGMVLAGGWLWVPGHDGVLYGLDPRDGRLRYPVEIGGRLSSTPLVVDDRLYVSVDVNMNRLGREGEVVEVESRTGRVLRRWLLSWRGLRAQPALLGDTLYVGDRQGRFHLLDLRHEQVKEVSLQGGRILGAALVDRGRGLVILGDSYGQVLALNADGEIRWSYRLSNSSTNAIVGQPCLHDGMLFIGAEDGRIYALDPATGQPVREPFATHGPIATTPVGWQHLIFVGSNDGYLYAVEGATGRQLWQYHSGSPIGVAPAVTANGRLFVVDSQGRLNALLWCLTQYAEAARRAEAAQPPQWEQAIELWMLANDADAALAAAEKANRPDVVAELAAELNWYSKAAQANVQLAGQARKPERAVHYWTAAAKMWELAQRADEAQACRLKAAKAQGVPLLTLEITHLPQLREGWPETLHGWVRNLTEVRAADVIMTCRGHVHQSERLELGSLGPREELPWQIQVVPAASGSATVVLTLRYTDPQGRAQLPEQLEISLGVSQPPEVHHHYHGPYVEGSYVNVAGDGVITMRGAGKSQTTVQGR